MAKDRVVIDGETYERVTRRDAEDRAIVRCRDAGVFFAEVVNVDGTEADLRNVRRIWYWDGAASLSELALRGPSKPQNCKFPAALPEMYVTGVIEVIPVTAEAAAVIDAVPEWTEHA